MTLLLWLVAGLMVFLIGGALWMFWLARGFPSEKQAGTFADHFIYVREDGTARELSADERDYLNTDFHPADGNRPYIKSSYRKLAPDHNIAGFLLRKRLPRRVSVGAP